MSVGRDAGVYKPGNVRRVIVHCVSRSRPNRPKTIDGSAPGQRQQPCRNPSSVRVVALRLLPCLRKNLLHDVLGLALTAEDSEGQRVHRTSMAVIKTRESC